MGQRSARGRSGVDYRKEEAVSGGSEVIGEVTQEEAIGPSYTALVLLR